MYSIPILPANVTPINPMAFLDSTEGTAWVNALAHEFPYTAFDKYNRNPWSLQEMNKLAAEILKAKRERSDPVDMIASWLGPNSPSDLWYTDIHANLKDVLEERVTTTASQPDIDLDDWLDEAYLRWADLVEAADTSDPSHALAQADHCEILFALTPGNGLDDDLIVSHKRWSDPSELAITTELQFALSRLGYTIGEFRNLSGNKHAPFSPLKRGCKPGRKLLDWHGLEQIIENACASSFIFGVYAIVPVLDLIKLDPQKPIQFDKAWICTTDPINGTFMEYAADGPVILKPGDGRLMSCGELAYSPHDIVGLVERHFHSNIHN